MGKSTQKRAGWIDCQCFSRVTFAMKIRDCLYNRGLGAYLALAFSTLSILLTVIMVEIIGVAITGRIKSNIGNGLAELAVQTSDKLDRGMFERFREVQLISLRHELGTTTGRPERTRAMLEALQETYPYYAWIGVTDASGKVTIATKGMLEGLDVSARPWFRNALKGIYLGDVHEAILLAKLLPNPANQPMRFVDVAFPYTDRDGRLAGVLGAHLSWQWAKDIVQSIIEPLAARRHVELLIVGANGTVLQGPSDMMGKTVALPSFTAAQKQSDGFSIETWPDGKQYLVGYSTSRGHAIYPGLGWTVLVRQSINDAYLPVKHIQQQVLWSGIAMAALFSLLGFFAARRISRPLLALTQSARRIENGEAAEIAPSDAGYYEVRALTGSLNSLVGNLLQKEAALKELNLTLEKRVEHRTRELERALATVSANKDRIRSIIETAPYAFIGADLKGSITDWNSSAERMFGWTGAEAIGRPLSEMVIPPRFQESFEKSMRMFHAGGKTDFVNRRIERLVVNRSGDEFPVEVTIGLVGANETYFFSAFLQDISDRKEVERMKNEFVSTVSHELRTPLTSIRGSLGLVIGGAVGEFPPQAKSLLDIANKNCERLVRMINDMLDIEKIESGNMRFEMVTQPLVPLVEQAIDATHGYAAQFNVKVELLSDAADIQVTVDRDRIIQVIVNLLSNAIKFSPAGGTVQARLSRKAGQVRLSIADHGDGIPKEFRSRIFQKFAQVDSDARKKGGTGLGLSICKSIVEEHRGHIDFLSEGGIGTEFYVDLPIAEGTSAVST
jgi:PAS domain S-box-containing protein